MKREITKKELYEFLIKNNCLNSFLNYTNDKEIKKIINFFPEDAINTFAWHLTEEGVRFWSNINDNWVFYISDNILINKKNKIYKIFIRFLKENNIYNRYLNKAKIRFPYMKPKNFITNAFFWDTDDYHFWAVINEKWKDIYKDL